MTRGIDAPHASDNICTVKFKWLDMVFFIVALACGELL